MSRRAVVRPKLVTLILLSGLSIVSLNMFLPSLPNIALEFNADYAIVNLSIAGYAFMTAILQIVMGPLSDRFGRRPVILSGLVLFCLASLGCALARNIESFLVFRMIQASIISGYAVSLAIIRDSSEDQKAASLIGYVATVWAFAPMLGPMLGGVLDEFFGWRASFWAFLAAGAAVLGLCSLDLRETNLSPSKTLREQIQTYPELFRSRRFWGYTLCMTFSTGAFYVYLSGVPLVASILFDLSIAGIGLYMGGITAGFILGSFLAGRYSTRFALTTMMLAGRIVACTGLLAGLLILAIGLVHPATLFGLCVFVGIGNGITMPSCNSGVMSVRPRLAGSASGLCGALTVAGGAVLSAITGVVISGEGAGYVLLGMMLLTSALGLVATLFVMRVDRSESFRSAAAD
ncbi:MAG: multidrug effflux MFS transporter [Gammaproteobacteria bacterium]|nr:multidrug effflux MFS transporter [Gammaproteobacteria bacterium]MYD76548.1 multidrug effflux MFS transporter [Gammaproteobacteria bacterium]MYJ51435.1 multidrug effflux MFS transporter [Gammaproteobacteria bacterium]